MNDETKRFISQVAENLMEEVGVMDVQEQATTSFRLREGDAVEFTVSAYQVGTPEGYNMTVGYTEPEGRLHAFDERGRDLAGTGESDWEMFATDDSQARSMIEAALGEAIESARDMGWAAEDARDSALNRACDFLEERMEDLDMPFESREEAMKGVTETLHDDPDLLVSMIMYAAKDREDYETGEIFMTWPEVSVPAVSDRLWKLAADVHEAFPGPALGDGTPDQLELAERVAAYVKECDPYNDLEGDLADALDGLRPTIRETFQVMQDIDQDPEGVAMMLRDDAAAYGDGWEANVGTMRSMGDLLKCADQIESAWRIPDPEEPEPQEAGIDGQVMEASVGDQAREDQEGLWLETEGQDASDGDEYDH